MTEMTFDENIVIVSSFLDNIEGLCHKAAGNKTHVYAFNNLIT